MMKDPNKEKKEHRRLPRILALILTAVLVLGAVAAVAFRDSVSFDSLKRYLNYRSTQTGSTGEAASFPYDGGDDLSFARLGTSLLISSSAGVNLYSSAGKVYESEVLAMSRPVLTADGKYGAVYDAGGQTLRLYDETSKVFSLTLDTGYGYLSARPNADGWLAVTAQKSGYKGAVTVYNAKHDKVIELDYSSAFVLDASVSEDCKTVAVVTLAEGAASFETNVLFYKVDSEDVQNTVSLGNTTVLDLRRSGSTLRALGESSLSAMSDSGGDLCSYSFASKYLKSYSLGGDDFSVLLLGKYRAGAANQIVAVSDAGQETGNLSVSGQVLALSAAGRYFAVLTADRLDIYTSDCQLYATLNGTDGAKYVEMNDDGSVMLGSDSDAWLYLPN